ncbi:Bardet-Biedl syndrome 7 protein homolog isoform X1 [Vanessa atalanta]|uniref:Bardet-Biedl syndrome 7 protein homolog isoform X1 n=1 Tax=Vanessa atalanta TaxID=42275 RepID=UPI001FCDE39A|nr:Bardet-Biedl syndrome 7 protein homolog isoform X1 [Vanessa atalanta]
MDYDLARIDYTLCGVTYPDALKILPSTDQKVQQKFAVGDKNGVLQCLSIKDEEPVVHFKTLPGKAITSVQLASSVGTNADKIFAASGNEVKGYTKKGKVFFSIETSVSETITSMIFIFRCVLGNDLILCSGRTVTLYRELQEIYCYVCEDRVLDAIAFATRNRNRIRILVLIANKEALIIENGNMQKRTHISAGPTRFIVPHSVATSEVYAFYGAVDGSIGLITYDESELSAKCLVEGCGLGSIMCVGWFTNNSGTHLAVGRHDGSIQLYLVSMDDLSEKPRLKFTYFSGEPVTSVCGGCIGTDEPELLVTTFSGRIFGLRSSRLIASSNKTSGEALATRRSKLESEVSRLEKQTANEREKYKKNTRSSFSGVSAPPLLDIQHELSGATHNGWQEAKITSAVPLDMLFVYCDSQLEIQTDNAAVLSTCAPQEYNRTELLTTIRCQAGTRRVWLRMRIVNFEDTKMEGTRVLVYILPAGAPRVARVIKFHLPILPHYSKYEPLEIEENKRPWCELQVSGGFSVAEITSWLTDVLPGELPRPANKVSFARSHSFLGTSLICKYQRGSAVFKSDNISTIVILKNFISNCCLKRNIREEISFDVPEDFCVTSFQLLKDKFKSEYQRKKEMDIKKAISSLDLDEMTINDETMPILCEDYLLIYNSSDDNNTETNFDQLMETVTKWYVDWWKLYSTESFVNNDELKRLQNFLKNCQLDEVQNIMDFKQKSSQNAKMNY